VKAHSGIITQVETGKILDRFWSITEQEKMRDLIFSVILLPTGKSKKCN